MKAAGYTRVSTEEQARDGYGLAAQEEAVRSFCKAHGWELVDVYTDAGVSGKSTAGRVELARLKRDAKMGAFERLVFVRLDRIARNARDLLNLCEDLEGWGVSIVSIEESIDTGTIAGRFMRTTLGAIAQMERELIADRIRAALSQKARQGELVGQIPLGYQRDDSGAIVKHPTIAPLIRAAFERYATGRYSMRDMAAWSVGVGLLSSEGNPLDRLSVRKILSNESYTGMVKHRGTVVNGKHSAIVDAALFAEVQEKMRDRNHYFQPAHPFGRQPYPLSGVAVCGHCSTSLVGMTRSQQSDRYRYEWYRCSTSHRRGKAACEQPMVRTNIFEGQIAAYVGGMKLPAEYLGEVVEELRRRQSRPDKPEERASLRRELERCRTLFRLGEYDEHRLRAETAPLRARLAEIEQPLEVLNVGAAVGQLRDVEKLWGESPRALQRQFVREVFQRITVTGPAVAELMPRPAYAPLFVLDRRERFGQTGPDFPVVDWLPGQDSNL